MMQYQVFIQNPADRLFTASVVGLPNVQSNGTTEEEAIVSLKGLLMDQDVLGEASQNQTDPWLNNIGIFQDDPTFDDFLTEVQTYRSEVDAIEL
jgi:hypothetical protein